MSRVEVGSGQWSIELRVSPRDGEADPRQHVVSRHPIHVVLIDLRPHYHPLFILLFLPPPLTCSLLSDGLRPPEGVVILGNIVEVHIGVYRARGAPTKC